MTLCLFLISKRCLQSNCLLQFCTIYIGWLLSAFKPKILISIEAWLLLKHTDKLYCMFLKYLAYWVPDWLVLVSAAIGPMFSWIPVGLSTFECVVNSCTVKWDPAPVPVGGNPHPALTWGYPIQICPGCTPLQS